MRVLPATVSVAMVSKAAAGDGPAEPAGDVLERAAGCMRSAGLDVAGSGLILEARAGADVQAPAVSVRFAADGSGALEQAEIVVGAECGYRDFEGCVAEMRDAQVAAREALSTAGLAPDRAFRIVCRIKSIPRARAMLDSMGADMVSCATPGGRAFDLYGDRIEYYDTRVHRGMMSFLKGVLAARS